MRSKCWSTILGSIAFLWLLATTVAQSTNEGIFVLDPTDCVATPVTMSFCTSFMSKLDNCFYTSQKAAVASCFCPQSVLNYLAGCHQEWWDCLRSTVVDSLFTGTNGLYYTWSTMCTQLDALSYGPTTMSITTPAALDQQFCNEVASDCATLTLSTSSCYSAYRSAPSDLDSCLCNDDILYYGSRCDIDANEKCLFRTLDPALVYSNQVCGNVATTKSVVRTTSLSSTSASMPAPTSTYVPPMPTSTASAGATTTSAGQSEGSVLLARHGMTNLAFAIAVAVLIV